MNHNPRTSPRANFFATGFLPIAVFGSETELEQLREYLLTVTEFVDREAGDFTKGVAAAVRATELTDDEEADFYSAHEEEFEKWHSAFPTTVLSSVLLTGCATFEGHLADLAVEVDQNAVIPKSLSWEKTSDTGVRRVAKYFRSNFLIHFEDFKLWTAILEAYRIRDAFVHASGRVGLVRKDNQAALLAAIKMHRKNGVSVDELGRIKITKEFVDRLLMDMRDFRRSLREALIDNAVIGPVYWK